MTGKSPDKVPDDPTPCCSRCGGEMRPYRLTPKLGGLPELVTYECIVCGDVVTELDK